MRRLLVGIVGFLIGMVALVATAAAGGQDEDPPTLRAEVIAGYDGFYVPARPVPVRVTLTATELTSGQLQVRAGGNIVEVIDVEVTAGSSEDHWVLVDTPQGDGLQVSATLLSGNAPRRAGSTVVTHERDVLLMGVLPSLGAGRVGDDIALPLLGQEIHLVDLAPELLDLGPDALAALDGVAMTPDDVASLSDDHRATLLGWLHTGGTLYVDGSAGPLVDWPDELAPGAPPAGLANVVATDGALAAGRWAEVVVPAPSRSIYEDFDAAQNLVWPDLFMEFNGVDLGRDLPPLTRLLAILGLYILVVGPVVYLVSKKRVMLRWVAIPTVAVLATAGLAASGEGLGDDTAISVVDVIETGPGAAVATTRVLAASDRGGREVVTPAGWSAENDDFISFGTEVVQRRTAAGVAMTVPAPAGGVGYLAARGPVVFEGSLDIRAIASDDGVVRGEVTNTTGHALTDVAVFAGRSAGVVVGDLEPGSSAEFELTGTSQFRFSPRTFQEVWSASAAGAGSEGGPSTTTAPFPVGPDEIGPIVSETCDQFGNCESCDADGNCFGFANEPSMVCDEFGNCFSDVGCGNPTSPACRDRAPRTEALVASLWDRGSNVLPPGLITAVGWSRDIAPQVDLGTGVDIVEQRTAVVSRAVPVTTGERLVDSGVVRTLASVRNDETGNIEIVFRFDLPAAVGDRPVDPTRLRIDVPQLFQRAAVITTNDDGSIGELVLRDGQPGERAQDRVEGPVPPSAIFGRSVFVRATLPFEPPRPGRELVIYEAAA